MKSVLAEIKSEDSIGFKGSKETLRRTLIDMGFVWRKCSDNRKLLMERSDIVAHRINFLHQMKKYREGGWDIVYTDESYVNSGHTVDRCWQTDKIGLSVPFNKGERMIIVHAGTKYGFIPGAKLVFKANSNSGDYHSEMNFNNFTKWLNERLIPNLKSKSVVVLDNASYHNVQVDKCPTTATRKAEIQAWLHRNNIPFTSAMLKPELLELCKKNKTAPVYVVDETLKANGHCAIRLPPYHADLNAIELIWGDLKGFVSRNNLTFKFKDVKELIEAGFDQITDSKWNNCCEHVERVEKNYWDNDIAVEDEVEKIIIEVDGDDDSDISDYDDDDYDDDTEVEEDVLAYECDTDIDNSDQNAVQKNLINLEEDDMLDSEKDNKNKDVTGCNGSDNEDVCSAYDYDTEIYFSEFDTDSADSIGDTCTAESDVTVTADEQFFSDETLTAEDTLTADETLSSGEIES